MREATQRLLTILREDDIRAGELNSADARIAIVVNQALGEGADDP
jgi:hypothetical protein